MPKRTDIREDRKGDLDKELPRQDTPYKRRPPGVEPLLPQQDRNAAPNKEGADVPPPPDVPEGAQTQGDKTE